ncbi:MAG: serine/threonine-protein kinase [Myxococcota bacterium]
MNAPRPHKPEWVLGQFELVTRIASGGSGSVFLARDSRDGSEVVVKFIDAREDALNGWVREMRIALRLAHPKIVRCRTVGFDETLGAWALVYDYAKGGSLRRALVQGSRLGSDLSHAVLSDIAQALAFAHEQGVIHRDVKPENIVLSGDGPDARWQLTDFGDARFLARGGLAETVVGSLSYMAPETFVGKTTQLSDQYSLGAVGLECIRGSIQSRQDLRALSTEGSPLEAVVSRMLSPHPSDRFPTIDAVAHLLACLTPATSWYSNTSGCAVHHENTLDWWHENERLSVPAARFSRFVHCTGTGVGALLGHRLVHLQETRKTIYADESHYVPLCFDGQGNGWIARENELARTSPQGVEASGPWSGAEAFCKDQSIIAACSAQHIVAGRPGAKDCMVGTRLGDSVIANVKTLPFPLDTLTTVDGSVRVLTADDRQTLELELREGELIDHARYPAPRGHVRYVDNTLSLVRFFDTAEFFSSQPTANA